MGSGPVQKCEHGLRQTDKRNVNSSIMIYISKFNHFYVLRFRSKQLIKDAILDNDFLKNLGSTQVREIVDCMYAKQIKAGQFIIREGEAGQHLYVSAGE